MTAFEILIIVLQFVLSLSLLIILHEMGHMIPARIFKMRVEKFFLFFDVKFALLKKKIGETVYGIGWLPLGGYVKISGMIDESMDKEQMAQPPQPWEFRSKPAWQRLIVMLGGVIVNFILAWLIYVGMMYTWGEQILASKDIGKALAVSEFMTEKTGLQTGDEVVSIDGEGFESFNEMAMGLLFAETIKIRRDGQEMDLQVPEDFIGQLVDTNAETRPIGFRGPFLIAEIPDTSANAGKGLQVNDIVLDVDDRGLRYYDEISDYIASKKDTVLQATVLRDGNTFTNPIYTNADGKLAVIVTGAKLEDLGKLGFYNLSVKEYSFAESFGAGSKRFVKTFKDFGKQLKIMVTPSTGAYKGVGSFISIAKIFPTTWDWEIFWKITAFLSIMLGVLNLLPIPALDGGHAMFLIYELVAGRKPGDKFMEYAQVVGFIFLISLFVFAFGNDIYRHFIK
ncbi:MAG: RIP metalloprotease RseP [Flavobacteriaceae bacterium]|nr:RIP metalloprotease RseP [Flavobacteriaceae bacterium]